MNKQGKIATELHRALTSSESLERFLESQRYDEKLRSADEKRYREAVAIAAELARQTKADPKHQIILNNLRKKPGHTDKEPPSATFLRELIHYQGKSDSWRLSRDKTVAEYLIARKIPFKDAAEEIRKNGGLQETASIARGNRGGLSRKKRPGSSSLPPLAKAFGKKSKMAVVLLSRPNTQSSVVHVLEACDVPFLTTRAQRLQYRAIIEGLAKGFERIISRGQ